MHTHSNHQLVKGALKKLAKESGKHYGEIKLLFINGDYETTVYFWEIFYKANPYRAKGVNYCNGCKKFYLEFYSPVQHWTFEDEQNEWERRAKALN